MFGLAVGLHPELGEKIRENHDNLVRILVCMIPEDLQKELHQIWQEIFKGFGTFEDFLVLSLLEQFLANKAAAYVALHPNRYPPQCTFWQHHEDRICQAAHENAVKETLCFIKSLSSQTPGLPSDSEKLSQRPELVSSVNVLGRQILWNHAESKRIELELAQEKSRVNPEKMVQQLEIFFQVCVQTNLFVDFPEILAYVSSNGLLPLLEKIKKIGVNTESPTEQLKSLQVSEPEMEIVQAIVFNTIEAACLGLISKSKQKSDLKKVLSYILETIEAGHYWTVVSHSMAEFAVKHTFFEQKMLELVTPSE
jgi:hypothetical protein